MLHDESGFIFYIYLEEGMCGPLSGRGKEVQSVAVSVFWVRRYGPEFSDGSTKGKDVCLISVLASGTDIA